MLIPPINARGKFTFKPPFEAKMKEDLVYTVTAIRSIVELYESESDPYKQIYEDNGISKDEYTKDLENQVPIVVFTTTGTDFFYIQATYIASTPVLTGHKYQEVVIGVKLGLLPEEYNFNAALQIINDDIRDSLGVIAEAKAIPASSTVLVDDVDHQKMLKLLANSKNVFKSYKTRYKEFVHMDRAKDELIESLEREVNKLLSTKDDLEEKLATNYLDKYWLDKPHEL